VTQALHIVGARPNFMKMAAVHRPLAGRLEQLVVHTGQHYDWRMSGIFFDELGVPAPDVNLDVGSGTHAAQTAEVMVRLETLLLERRPQMVIVYGDVNSTLAATLVCSKMGIAVAHVEAGLRSRDRTMPEEINRLVTDALADLLFTPSEDGNVNLAAEGVPSGRVYLVGNVMIDTLVRLLPRTDPDRVRESLGIGERFALVTLHRPSNVDDVTTLAPILLVLADLAASCEVVFPVHPRTRARLQESSLPLPAAVHLVEPLGYLDFLSLQRVAAMVITDSGGIQEESTYLGVPCLTVRDNTERPVTISHGTNQLVGRNPERLRTEAERLLAHRPERKGPPPLWDGHAGDRIADILEHWHA
jgi:UDP-N-acetylglucosamine 2-epimerase (non-hydrolysing)